MSHAPTRARRMLWLTCVVAGMSLAAISPTVTHGGPEGAPRRGWIGLVLRNLLATERESLGRAGVRVSGVQPGSPAQRAGFTLGDIIVALNGSMPGGDARSLAMTFRGFQPGEEVAFTVVRSAGVEAEIRVTVAAYDSLVALEACLPLAVEFLVSQSQVAQPRAGHHARRALALHAMARVPAKLRAAHSSAIDALAKDLVSSLLTITRQPIPDYLPPEDHYLNYRAALTVGSLNNLDPTAHADDVALLTRYLRKRQLGVPDGTAGDFGDYAGSWNYREPDSPGSVRGDLSVTAYVVEALATSSGADSEPLLGLSNARRQALRQFVYRCQNWGPVAGDSWDSSFPPAGDGGFFFAPGESKAGYRRLPGRDGYFLLSYGTATADAYRTLLRLGEDASSPRMRAALDWLLDQDDLRRNPGFPVSHRIGFNRGLRFYWLRSLSDALAMTGADSTRTTNDRDVAWAHDIADYLCPRQLSNRSWVNSSGVMGEDDPLVATSFSLLALTDCWRALQGD